MIFFLVVLKEMCNFADKNSRNCDRYVNKLLSKQHAKH